MKQWFSCRKYIKLNIYFLNKLSGKIVIILDRKEATYVLSYTKKTEKSCLFVKINNHTKSFH